MGSFDKIDRAFLSKYADLKWGKLDKDVIPLSVADIDFPPPPEVKEAIRTALEEDRAPYGDYAGDPDVLEVLCEKLKRVNRIPAEPDDVHMIPGTKFSIFMACYYALKPGFEAVICPAPIYPPFIKNIYNAGGIPVFTPLDYSRGGEIDFDLLKSQITPRTRLIMVCNPHNPTGRVLTLDELDNIGRIACEHDLLIYVDELYEDMILDGEHVSMASLSEELFERTISVFGFSKAFAIPGFRIAYLVNRGKHMLVLKDIIHDIIVHTDRLAQAAAKGATISGGPWLGELHNHLSRAREYSYRRITAISGITCMKPQATFFLFPDISAFGMCSTEMTDYLRKEAGIIVQSGSDFGPCGEGHIRLNFGTAMDVLEEAFNRMERALGKLVINIEGITLSHR